MIWKYDHASNTITWRRKPRGREVKYAEMATRYGSANHVFEGVVFKTSPAISVAPKVVDDPPVERIATSPTPPDTPVHKPYPPRTRPPRHPTVVARTAEVRPRSNSERTLVMIRSCTRDDYIARLALESMKRVMDADFYFAAETHSSQSYGPGAYDYADETAAPHIPRAFCDNFCGNGGAQSVINMMRDALRLGLGDDTWLVISDCDIVMFRNPLPDLKPDVDHGGLGARYQHGSYAGPEFIHMSGQINFYRGSYVKRVVESVGPRVADVGRRMLHLGINLLDDTFISFVGDHELKCVKQCVQSPVKLGNRNHYWVHWKCHGWKGVTDWDYVIREVESGKRAPDPVPLKPHIMSFPKSGVGLLTHLMKAAHGDATDSHVSLPPSGVPLIYLRRNRTECVVSYYCAANHADPDSVSVEQLRPMLGQWDRLEQQYRAYGGPKVVVEYSEMVSDPLGTINWLAGVFGWTEVGDVTTAVNTALGSRTGGKFYVHRQRFPHL